MKAQHIRPRWAPLLLLVVLIPAPGLGQPQTGRSTQSGTADRGRPLYVETYKCFACHGYAGETGSPRLNPMRLDQAAFLAFVRSGSPGGAMPSYRDAPIQDLVDIYAYVRSLRSDAPPVESIPLLQSILRDIESDIEDPE